MNKDSNTTLTHRVELLAEALLAQRLTLSTAESCTGGWIAQVCTELAGSSHWFQGGIVSYSNAAKISLLGVPEDDLYTQGAVSQRVAEAMAIGARRALDSDLSVAVTGVAGPDGGSAEKPVGTVWLAWGNAARQYSRRVKFEGDRHAVRQQTVALALDLLLAFVKENPEGIGNQ